MAVTRRAVSERLAATSDADAVDADADLGGCRDRRHERG
jgi:hypothetical protein